MKRFSKYFTLLILLFMATGLYSQTDRKPISIQGIIKQGDELLINQQVFFQLGLYNDSNQTALWEETQGIPTNEYALFNIYLGTGSATGNAQTDDFDEVIWSDPIWLKIEYRLNEADDFKWMGTRKFQAMPFAMYADSASGEGVGVTDLFDVENNEQLEYVLKWDGVKWLSSPDAIYAWNTFNADSSITSDTAFFAWSTLFPIPTDTVDFAFYSDSVAYTAYSDTSLFSAASSFADTVVFANDVLNAWKLLGNSGNNQLGSLDFTDFVIKINNNEAFRFTAAGEILINSAMNDHADLQTKGTVVMEGLHQPFSLDTTLGNIFYWEPKKSSIVIGLEMSPYFVDTTGRYSFAGGRMSQANSYSFAWGDSCSAIGNNVFAIGKNCMSTEVDLNKHATGVAIGQYCISVKRSVALGNNVQILGGSSSSVGIGNNILLNMGQGAIAMGSNITNNDHWSYLFGSNISATTRSIMFADHSTGGFLIGVVPNQFQIRASGGTTIFSDSMMTTGVVLFSGSGSWAMLSDRDRKENITSFDWSNSQSTGMREINIYRWNYKSQNKEVIHFGTMAQAFNSSFRFKEDVRMIYMIDMDGFTFSGIRFLLERFNINELELQKVEDRLEVIQTKQEQILELLGQYELIQKEGKP